MPVANPSYLPVAYPSYSPSFYPSSPIISTGTTTSSSSSSSSGNLFLTILLPCFFGFFFLLLACVVVYAFYRKRSTVNTTRAQLVQVQPISQLDNNNITAVRHDPPAITIHNNRDYYSMVMQTQPVEYELQTVVSPQQPNINYSNGLQQQQQQPQVQQSYIQTQAGIIQLQPQQASQPDQPCPQSQPYIYGRNGQSQPHTQEYGSAQPQQPVNKTAQSQFQAQEIKYVQPQQPVVQAYGHLQPQSQSQLQPQASSYSQQSQSQPHMNAYDNSRLQYQVNIYYAFFLLFKLLQTVYCCLPSSCFTADPAAVWRNHLLCAASALRPEHCVPHGDCFDSQ